MATAVTSVHFELNTIDNPVHAKTEAAPEATTDGTAKHENDDSICLGDYLLERLVQLGVTHMFGVPGDFNLGFLDLVEDHKNIEWVGNCNELNAAYSADGYARIKKTLGVLLTTFGVGELSALNGQAGAYAEQVPFLHIAGAPSTSQIKNKILIHHTLGNGRFDAYAHAAESFSTAQALLTSLRDAPEEIDRVLTAALTQARPSYLLLPMDMVYEKVPAARLRQPLDISPPSNDAETEAAVVSEIVKLVEKFNGEAVVLVDVCAIRHQVLDEVHDLVTRTQFPVYTTSMGKTAVSEQHPRYRGVYAAANSMPGIQREFEAAKLVITIGPLRTDVNTGGFTAKCPKARCVELNVESTKVLFATYPGIGMKGLLPKLTSALERIPTGIASLPPNPPRNVLPTEADERISQAWLWPRAAAFLKPNDLVIGEMGTSAFGLQDITFPEGAILVSQMLWGSIGWSVGAALGAATAAKANGLGRVILFIGDGSLQLTAQELTTIMRQGLSVTVFLLNNKGYTIERLIRGKTRVYNDIKDWRWTSLLGAFGGEEGVDCQSYTVGTKEEMNALLGADDFANSNKTQLVEVLMDKLDAPRALLALVNGLSPKAEA